MNSGIERQYVGKYMKPFFKYTKKICSRKLILVTGIVYGVFQTIIVWLLYPLGLINVLTLQITRSSDVVHDILSGWEDNGEINRYLFHYYLDFPLPVLYGCLLVALFSKFLEQFKLHSSYKIVTILPLLVGGLDIFENLSHLTFIYFSKSITPFWVGLSGTASCIKWLLLFLSLLMFAWFCIKFFIRNVWTKR